MAAENVVKWLRECFREDRAPSGVKDFFSSAVQQREILSGREELACGWMPEVILAPSYVAKAHAHAMVNRREQEAVYGCLFLCGKNDGKPFRAPLIFYLGKFESENTASFSIDLNRWRINPRALELLQTDAEALTEILKGGELSEGVIGDIRRWADQLGVDTEPLWQWPELAERSVINEAAKKKRLSLHPAGAIGFLPRSRSSRGIIDELDTLAGSAVEEWSAPLSAILGAEPMRVFPETDEPCLVPVLLSQAQEKILSSARVNPVTLCHGPPGTGKSFTISAIAIDHAVRGETVLVASRNDSAVDVVHHKIDSMLGGDEVTVRAGRQDHLKKLKKFMEACLAGQMSADVPSKDELKALRKIVDRISKNLDGDEVDLEHEWKKALTRGELMADEQPNWLQSIQKAWAKSRVAKRQLLMELTASITEVYMQRSSQLSDYLREQRKYLLHEAVKKDSTRRDFKLMLQALRKHRGSEQEQVFKKMELGNVLEALPVWLVDLDDVHRVLPMEKELFDVAIIDESSQCDLASVLPLMQRAKRVVIAGDAQQLRHISFLTKSRMSSLADELGVSEEEQEVYNYRNVSLMDYAAVAAESHSQVGFLNEHFRSSPRIIAFSNKQFYQNKLVVMREWPWVNLHSALTGERSAGTRNKAGVNELEAVSLLNVLRNILAETKVNPDSKKPSIGILSPFRNQVEAIRELMLEHFNEAERNQLLGQHQLLTGTAHSFQGEERDVMLISLCVDTSSNHAVLRFIEREDVFNVAITRAKSQQIICHSLDADDLPQSSLLGKFLRHVYEPEQSNLTSGEMDSFAEDVAESLKAYGITVSFSQSVAGVVVDVILNYNGSVIGLDLIGYPGVTFPAVDRHRTQVLRRADFVLVPLGYTEWCTQKEYVIAAICKMLIVKLRASP